MFTALTLRVKLTYLPFSLAPLFFASACNPIPNYEDCEEVRFNSVPEIKAISYFSTVGIFEQYCPGRVPNLVGYNSKGLEFEIEIDHQWLRVKFVDSQSSNDVSSSNATVLYRKAMGFNVRVDSIQGEKLSLLIDGETEINLSFTKAECACVFYDSI